MVKQFTDGLVFGAGFTITFTVIWYVAAYLSFPAMVSLKMEKEANPSLSQPLSEAKPPEPRYPEVSPMPEPQFHELGIDDQIKQASVIALARYKPASDGKMKAVITEFLKKEPDVTIYYEIGDEFQSASYYPKANVNHGDGLVIFFAGSPAMMRMSMTYSGDRIHGLADLPIELLRNKCKDQKASAAGKN